MKLGWRYWFACSAALSARPKLWFTALRQARRMTPSRWWRHKPFLPVPSPRYLRFRLETQYGHEGIPQVQDFIDYLKWCQSTERQLKASTSGSY